MKSQSLDPGDPKSLEAFIRANTRALAPPLTPEIVLHLAEESLPIWRQTEEQLGEMNVPPPYWAFAWAGGQALARWLLDNPSVSAGRRVIDLGAGSGLASIAAAKSDAAHVLAADIDRLAIAACRLNAAINSVKLDATAADQLAGGGGAADVVLIGDLFYERGLADRVSRYIADAKARGAVVLIGDPQRSYFPRDRFERLAEYAVPVTRELEDAEIKRTAVWRA